MSRPLSDEELELINENYIRVLNQYLAESYKDFWRTEPTVCCQSIEGIQININPDTYKKDIETIRQSVYKTFCERGFL
jgi:hypothetical protein